MKMYSFYHKDTGVFNGRTFSTDDDSQIEQNINIHVDHLPIEGMHNHLNRRVDPTTKEVVDYQSPAPSSNHEWNSASKQWDLTADAAADLLTRTLARHQIKKLVEEQHHIVRQWCLGMHGTREKLQEIEDEIQKLQLVLK